MCAIEPMESEDPLFTLYTSGSTGKPKGLVHTHAGYLLYAGLTHQVRVCCAVHGTVHLAAPPHLTVSFLVRSLSLTTVQGTSLRVSLTLAGSPATPTWSTDPSATQPQPSCLRVCLCTQTQVRVRGPARLTLQRPCYSVAHAPLPSRAPCLARPLLGDGSASPDHPAVHGPHSHPLAAPAQRPVCQALRQVLPQSARLW